MGQIDDAGLIGFRFDASSTESAGTLCGWGHWRLREVPEMPVFYFDTEINGGVRSRDPEGVPLPDVATAKQEAITALYCLARDLEPEVSPRRVTLFVRDKTDRVLFETDLNMTITER